MNKYRVHLRFTEPILGTVPGNPDIYKEHIQSKLEAEGNDNGSATDIEDEMETLPEALEKGTTGFHRLEDGAPALYDYAIKGFFKDACSMLSRDPESGSAKLRAFRKVIDGLVFVFPRLIRLEVPEAEAISILVRPLRAQTAKGERVALAASEACPAGTTCSFEILALGKIPKGLFREWLEYGALRGLGQWRNAGYGRFEATLTEVEAAQ